MRNIPSFIPSSLTHCTASPLFFLFDGVTARAATAVTARARLVILIKVNLAPTDSPLLLSMEREWRKNLLAHIVAIQCLSTLSLPSPLSSGVITVIWRR